MKAVNINAEINKTLINLFLLEILIFNSDILDL